MTAIEGARHHAANLQREAFTMGLYVSIMLLAALTVTSEDAPRRHVLGIIWGTTIGLALAHWFAFSLAARLVDLQPNERDVNRQLLAQLTGAFAVAAIATTTVVVLPEQHEHAGARLATAACIGVVAFMQMRSLGASRVRAAQVATAALVLGLVIAGVKHALTH